MLSLVLSDDVPDPDPDPEPLPVPVVPLEGVEVSGDEVESVVDPFELLAGLM